MRSHTLTSGIRAALLLAAASLAGAALVNLALVAPASARKHGKATAPASKAPEGKPQSADTQKTEAELQAVKSEIERVTRQVSNDEVEKTRLTKELRSAELSVGKAREGLDDLRRQRSEAASHRAALAAEKKQREADLAQ